MHMLKGYFTQPQFVANLYILHCSVKHKIIAQRMSANEISGAPLTTIGTTRVNCSFNIRKCSFPTQNNNHAILIQCFSLYVCALCMYEETHEKRKIKKSVIAEKCTLRCCGCVALLPI